MTVNIRKNDTGSFTVEAALLIPGIILLVFMVMTAVFILHDSVVTEAFAAYSAEEARMAVQYGRIPYSTDKTGIVLEGFSSEDDLEELEGMVHLTRSEMEKSFMFSQVLSKKAVIDKNMTKTTIKCSPTLNKAVVAGEFAGTYTGKAYRKSGNPGAAARITKIIYRTVKTAKQ